MAVRLGTMLDGGGKILIIGGGWFVGSNLVDRLLHDGYIVRVQLRHRRRENFGDVLGEIELIVDRFPCP
jgi:nucleoside-diphosphate-sugar epimerase